MQWYCGIVKYTAKVFQCSPYTQYIVNEVSHVERIDKIQVKFEIHVQPLLSSGSSILVSPL